MKTLSAFLFTICLIIISIQLKAQAPNIEWQNTIGGGGDDRIYSTLQTSDGGYFIGGTSYSDISGDKSEDSYEGDYWVVKLYFNGNIEWQNTISANSDDHLRAIQQTIDGGLL